MRTPGRPRKPTSLQSSTPATRTHGGEGKQYVIPDRRQDFVPTAPVDPLDFPDDYDDYVESSVLEEEPQRGQEVPERLVLAPVQLSERRQERRAERRKIWAKRGLIGLGSLMGTVFVIWLITLSPLFRYEFVSSDIQGLSADSIVDRTKLGEALKKHNGEQVFFFDDKALKSDIKKAVPEVADISSSYSFPSSRTFTVTEHVPVACVVKKDVCEAVAKDGTVLTVPADKLATLPKISDFPEGIDRESALTYMLGTLDALPANIRSTVSQITIDRHKMISLNLAGGKSVMWGKAEENARKAKILAILVAQDVKAIDLSVPGSPVTSN
ncbi:hypothetical protein EBF03_03295 [Arcanobacterium haemolyticum]|nr:hypothetical protein EBF03_03295 [Arcanobacterium haemolyticum]